MIFAHAEDTYRIRPATMADAPAIRQIRNAAVRESLAIWTSVDQDSATETVPRSRTESEDRH